MTSGKRTACKKFITECGSHLLTILSDSISDLIVSQTFFNVLHLYDSFLSVSVSLCEETPSFVAAKETVQNLACVIMTMPSAVLR